MSNVTLEIEGVRYSGWEGMSVARSIENISGSFSMTVSDSAADWPIVEEDSCRVIIDDQVVMTGFVERPIPAFSDTTSTLQISGHGKPHVLAVCSAILDKWSFRNATVYEIAKKLCEPYEIRVSTQVGLELAKAPRKLAVTPSDTVFDVLLAAARSSGVLIVSTPEGGILLTRAGTERATDSLIQGENLIAGSGDYDASGRFYRYIALGQTGGTDNAFGVSTRLRAEAFDEGVRRQNRTLIIRPDAGHSNAYHKRYADWTARNRAAAAKAVQVVVRGWTQSDGTLWPINARVPVKSPRLRIDGDMLISEAEHTKDEAGELTTLRLVRPDAFTPEPSARVKG